MARKKQILSPDRLCEAAQVSLRAAVEAAEHTEGRWPYPADLMGRQNCPECLDGFEAWEIEQACQFLVRLGMIEPRARRRHAA